MNRGSSYKKPISEELQELQHPDMEVSWQQMKQLLDREMPVTSVAPKGRLKRLLIIGSLLVLFSVSSLLWWMYPSNIDSTQQPIQPIVSQQHLPEEVLASELADKATNLKQNQDQSHTDKIKTLIVENKKLEVAQVEDRKDSALHPVITAAIPNSKITSPHVTDDNNIHQSLAVIPEGDIDINNERQTLLSPSLAQPVMQPPNDWQSSAMNWSMENADEGRLSVQSYQLASVPRENFYSSNHRPLQMYEADNKNGHLQIPEAVRQLPEVSKQRRAILREKKKAERRNERELAKSYRSSQSFWGASTDRWFAAGIAPYQNLAVGAQQYYGYNAAGSRGIATDYIPAPYLQFHVTDRVYLLSEFQFHNPQATPNILLAQKTNATPQSAWNIENTYLRKMYYFNMPLSFYYSPIKNIYIGSGVQFSSFNSGLAYRERLGTTNNVVHSDIIKVREDSLSSLISSSEWRYLVDANYYFNRIMLGVRYNQALSPYVNLRSRAGVPATQVRNQAVQLYLRFNLVESKTRK